MRIEDDADANVIDGGDVFLANSANESVEDSIEGRSRFLGVRFSCIHTYL